MTIDTNNLQKLPEDNFKEAERLLSSLDLYLSDLKKEIKAIKLASRANEIAEGEDGSGTSRG